VSLTPAFLDELRARTLLSGLIGKTVKLQKAGREFRACCPFHQEKTPSFYVNDDKGFYHCFGCSAHGDAIRWMTDQRGLPFIDAVKELAQAAGLEMPDQDRRAAEKAERAKGLHEAIADAATWFVEKLNGIEGAEARNVLKRRGITEETARAFGLGFAPDSRGKLKEALKSYGEAMLVEAGMLIQVEEREPYDRFRGRLMIPIRDVRGRTIAFGGRIIGDGEPKYLNSPETPLFDKGRTLYNLDRAQAAARKSGRILVVEGYMDVIALAQAGFEEAVAPLGTALTEQQLELLWRQSDRPTLCFDGDAAGQKAAIRAAHRGLPLLRPGRSLAFATLPAGQDPDDVIAGGGGSAFSSLLEKSSTLVDFIWKSELAGISEAPGPDERALLRDRLVTLASTIADATVAAEYRKSLLDRFFKTFGSRTKGLEVVRKAVAEARRHPGRGLEYTFTRAILLGLMRYPRILESHVEDVSFLPIKDRYLSEWRDLLIGLTYGRKTPLSEQVVLELLQATSIWPIEPRDFKRDLAFTFFRPGTDPSIAERDLAQVVSTTLESHVARQGARLADEVFQQEVTQEHFVRQQYTLKSAVASQERLMIWLDQLSEAA